MWDFPLTLLIIKNQICNVLLDGKKKREILINVKYLNCIMQIDQMRKNAMNGAKITTHAISQ